MATIRGIVSPKGKVVRSKGRFKVVYKKNGVLLLKVPNRNLKKAFVQAIPWRNDTDIGIAGITVSPDLRKKDRLMFAVKDYYGVSFEIRT